jgi:hypothetical protein
MDPLQKEAVPLIEQFISIMPGCSNGIELAASGFDCSTFRIAGSHAVRELPLSMPEDNTALDHWTMSRLKL